MAQTFFFYDLETSGLSAQDDRIMQFAGQRTDMEFNPIGEPVNEFIRLTEDTLPSPEALLITGITPQQTVADGYTEAEFARKIVTELFTSDTIVVGFNNIQFDDEFIRHLLWRTFQDPYEWSWKDGRSRWDILDLVRMTRALRPDGIEWPVNEDGVATNRLELITKLNGVDHYKAHDALSDVIATIEVAKLISDKQPQLFQYLLGMRNKREVMKLVSLDAKAPFVYTSGRLDAKHEKTTVAFPLTSGKNGNVIVYDLRYDPASFFDLDSSQLAKALFATRKEREANGYTKLPLSELQFNRAPAVAPLGVLEQGSGWERIHLDMETIEENKRVLLSAPHFAENIRSLFEQRPEFKSSVDAEARLYEGFLGEKDRIRVASVRNATEKELVDFHPGFDDERLSPLLLRYKARSYPRSMSEDEVMQWEEWRAARINERLPHFMNSITRVSASATDNQQFILQELQLWAESITPGDI